MLTRWGSKAVHRSIVSSYLLRLRSSPSPFLYSSTSALRENSPLSSSDVDAQLPDKLILPSRPRTLSINPSSAAGHREPYFTGLFRIWLYFLGYYNRKSIIMRRAHTIYSRVTNVVDNPSLYANFGLEENFRTNYSMLVIHLWLFMARTKGEKPGGQDCNEAVYICFQEDLEKRVVKAGVRMLFTKWMKDLEKMFYGAVQAYDEAIKPDAPKDALVHALWRNVFAEDDSPMPSGEQAMHVKSLAKYVRRETACFALTDVESLLSGNVLFSADKSWKLIDKPEHVKQPS